MSSIYLNITGTDAVCIHTGNLQVEGLHSIRLANVNTSNSVSIDLYVSDNHPNVIATLPNSANDWTPESDPTVNSYYILKTVVVPPAVSLILNEDESNYDVLNYKLYIKLTGTSPTVDVIIHEKLSNIKKNKKITNY